MCRGGDEHFKVSPVVSFHLAHLRSYFLYCEQNTSTEFQFFSSHFVIVKWSWSQCYANDFFKRSVVVQQAPDFDDVAGTNRRREATFSVVVRDRKWARRSSFHYGRCVKRKKVKNIFLLFSGEPTCQKTITLEKASILFNIAALYTQIGSKKDRTQLNELDAGLFLFKIINRKSSFHAAFLPLAAECFLQAAGIFQHIIGEMYTILFLISTRL